MKGADAVIPASMRPAEPKLLALEIIRFACAIIVLIFHFQHFAMMGDGSGMGRDHEPLAVILWPIYQYGSFGVHMFWAISGFIFYWKYADAIAARTIAAKRFFWLRFSRLYPLHFVTLLIVAALQPVHAALAGKWLIYVNSLVSFLLQLFLADQWAGARAQSFNGPIWSVSTEVFIYFAFFLLMRAFGRQWWLIPVAFLCGLAGIWTGGSSGPMICIGFFFAGAAAADWAASKRAMDRPREARGIALGLLAATIAFTAAFVDLAPNLAVTPTFLLVLCPPLLFLLAQDMPWLDRWQRPVQAAGNLTYATYLIHFPLQLAFAIVALGSGLAIPIDQAWFLAAYVAVVLLVGHFTFRHFEAPAQALIRAATLTPRRARAAA